MKNIGLQAQIGRNNFFSILLLILFPILLVLLVWVIAGLMAGDFNIKIVPIFSPILAAVLIWFVIAYFLQTYLIRWATGARPLDRKDNKRVYNLVENLCISQGMQPPKINLIPDDSLNAFASGIDRNSFTISLSKGLVEKLNDEELEGVIAHELAHIRNRDVRLLIISIVFVGIFSFIAEIAFRSLQFGGRKSRGKNGSSGIIILLIVVITALAYFISLLLRFGISRKREYLADAGAAEMTRRPEALANALRKISQDPWIEAVESRDVAQLFIDHPKPSQLRSSWDNLFASHPPIEKRIAYLEQFF